LSDTLKRIAARYAAGLRAAGRLAPVDDRERLERLRAVMRYGLAINWLECDLRIQRRTFADLREGEADKYFAWGLARDLGEFGAEDRVVAYITHCMGWLFPDLPRARSGVWAGKVLEVSALPEVLARFRDLPGAVKYGFTK